MINSGTARTGEKENQFDSAGIYSIEYARFLPSKWSVKR